MACSSEERHNIPVVSRTESNRYPGIHITVQNDVSFARSGRRANRQRHLHRRCKQSRLCSSRMLFATQNMMRLDWRRLDNRNKLGNLISACREKQWEVTFLSEITGEEPATVYIEEYLMVANKRSALLLSPAGRVAFEQAGQQWGTVGDRLVWAKLQTVEGETIVVVSVYAPTNMTVAEEQAWETECSTVHDRFTDTCQIWAGDFNAHIGADSVHDNTHTGPYKLLQASSRRGANWLK